MTRSSGLEAVLAGGKTALKTSATGLAVVLVFSFLNADRVIYLPGTLMGIAMISVLLGGIRCGLSAGSVGSVGWMHGTFIAALYSVALNALRILLFPGAGFNQTMLMQLCILLVIGSVGGVAGINAEFMLRRRKRHMGY